MSKLVDISLRLSGLLLSQVMPLFRHSGLRIIYYHTVSDKVLPYYWTHKQIDQATLVKQLYYLQKRYQFISLSEAIECSRNGQSLRGYCAFTTDDGFACNYHEIAPVLREFNIKPTYFLISDCIDNQRLMWRNMLYMIQDACDLNEQAKAINWLTGEFRLGPIRNEERLMQWSERTWPMSQKEILADALWQRLEMPNMSDFMEEHKPYMSQDQIRELHLEGFEFGVHSKSHPYFSKLSLTEFKEEINHCADRIEEIVKPNYPVSFAYPFGDRGQREIEGEYKGKSNCLGSILGINRKISNPKDPYYWERDKMELDYYASIGRFYLFPIIRSIIGK